MVNENNFKFFYFDLFEHILSSLISFYMGTTNPRYDCKIVIILIILFFSFSFFFFTFYYVYRFFGCKLIRFPNYFIFIFFSMYFSFFYYHLHILSSSFSLLSFFLFSFLFFNSICVNSFRREPAMNIP